MGRVLLTALIFDLDMAIFASLPDVASLAPEEVFSHSWAALNKGVLADAIAAVLGLAESAVLLQLSPVDERGGWSDPGSSQGTYSPFAFRLDLLLVLPDSPAHGSANTTEAEADAQDLERLMQLLLGPNWAGSGLSPSTAGGRHLFDELAAVLAAQGQPAPAGLQRAGTAVVAGSPSVVRGYVLPATATATTTTSATLRPCTTVPRPDHAVGDYDECVGLEHSATCEVTCERGYRSVGQMVCNNGSFVESSSPVCVVVQCSPPLGRGAPVLLPDGSAVISAGTRREDLALLNCSGLVFQSICEATCNVGFILDPQSGGSHLVCDAGGNFTGNATCTPLGQAESLRCHGEVPQFTGVEPARGCKGLWHGQNCSLFCKSGYSLSGASVLVCNHGTLETDTGNDPQCDPASCESAPLVPNGGDHSNCTGLPHGSVCVPRCLEGRRMVFGQIVCGYGEFRVTGKCVEDFVARFVEEAEQAEQAAAESGTVMEPLVTVSRGADVQLDINVNQTMAEQFLASRSTPAPDMVQATEAPPEDLFDYDWAIENDQLILDAVSEVLGLDPAIIEMDIFPLLAVLGKTDGRVRRLTGAGRALQDSIDFPSPVNGSFRLRLRFFLPEVTTTTLPVTTTVAEAGQASLTQEEALLQLLMDRFLKVIWIPVNSTDSANTTRSSNGTNETRGYYAPGFFHAVETRLKAEGLPVPSGLFSSALASSKAPVFLEELALFAPRWLVDVWGNCSCTGGPGIQRRTVMCTVDHLASCEALELQPATTQPCQCPTPPPIPWLDMSEAMTAGVGVGGLVTLCCLAFCCYELRRFSRSTKQGKARLLDQNNVLASYTVQDPNRTPTADGKVHVVWEVPEKSLQALFTNEVLGQPEDAEGEAGLDNTPEGEEVGAEDGLGRENSAASKADTSGSAGEAGQTHEGHEVGSANVANQLVDGHEAGQADKADEAVEGDEAGKDNESATKDKAEEAGQADKPDDASGGDEADETATEDDEHEAGQEMNLNHEARQQEMLSESCPMYQDNDQVEYFSTTHQCWLPGVIKLTFKATADGLRATYNVHIGRGNQWRNDVAIDALRLPLRQADPVEIYQRGRGVWLPAAICGVQASSSTTLGYRVQLEEQGEGSPVSPSSSASGRIHTGGGLVLDQVPAMRLRRLFPEGYPVEVYRGPPRGWVPAVVAADSMEDRHPAPLSLYSPRADNIASGTASATSAARLLHPWVMVPITEDSEHDAAEAEGQDHVDLVASYLLRLRTLYVLSSGTESLMYF